jgi:Transposase and inactivated derivatives
MFPLALMCNVLGVSRSGYYQHLKAQPSARRKRHESIKHEVIHFHKRSKGIYGYRKVAADIREEGENPCCGETVRRIMRENRLCAKVKHKFVVTTQSRHSLPVSGNVLERDLHSDAPNQKWLADITYIRTLEGWVYLASVLDLFSRRIVGWSMSDRLDAELACSALNNALRHRMPESGLLHHSDRGVQYASSAYQTILKRCGIVCSMSRKGNCWDNAGKESFFGKLKSEWIRGKIYATRAEARREIAEYIEVFYNCQRRHAALGYVSPVQFEKRGDGTTAA